MKRPYWRLHLINQNSPKYFFHINIQNPLVIVAVKLIYQASTMQYCLVVRKLWQQPWNVPTSNMLGAQHLLSYYYLSTSTRLYSITHSSHSIMTTPTLFQTVKAAIDRLTVTLGILQQYASQPNSGLTAYRAIQNCADVCKAVTFAYHVS